MKPLIRIALNYFSLLLALAVAFSASNADEPGLAKRYALLIAVTKYSNSEMNKPQLQFPEADAKAVGTFLSEHGYTVKYLLGSEANRKSIQQELQDLANHVNQDGAVFVGLWGHGVEFEGSKEAMFCPYDTKLRAVKASNGEVLFKDGQPMIEPNPESLVGMEAILLGLKLSGAGSRVLFADCCRNSPNRPKGRAFGSNVTTADLPDNTAAIFACQALEQAYEHPDWGHGALTRCFLDLLPSIANSEFDNVGSFGARLRRNVKQLVADRSNGLDVQTVVPLEKGVAELKLQSTERLPNAAGIEFVNIPAGSFMMGSPENEEGRNSDEGPQHRVTISKPFHAGKYEVTVGQVLQWLNAPGVRIESQWIKDGGENSPVRSKGTNWLVNSSDRFASSMNHPMYGISQKGAVAFCKWLSQQDPRFAYRLPTEAEWEYMARAGTTSPFWWGKKLNGDRANIDGSEPYGTKESGRYRGKTIEVGSFSPNGFGLFDTSGNVSEWCSNTYMKIGGGNSLGGGKYSAQLNFVESGVHRGASWSQGAVHARSAATGRYLTNRRPWIGFRVVCD
ncbi:MAG: SUMF1/EgtB/PvdO family nonheme iron enzyme [Planctomycetaceae bacterium]|nr:SUMF1/EgtB/PvdO family nonheme iron enzyme [Planctomycetaceae bacterium]